MMKSKHSQLTYRVVLRTWLTVLVGVLLIGAAQDGYAQGVVWSDPVPLSPDDRSAWFPDIVADASGHVHVAWAGGYDGFDTVWYTVGKSGEEWLPPNDIAAYRQVGIASIASRPALLVDNDGMLHMTSSNDTVFYSNAPVSTAYSAGAWVEPYKLNRSSTGYFTRTNVDSTGRLHLVITENVPTAECENCYHIFYRQSVDGGASWTVPVDVSVLPTGAAKPQILVDMQNNIHIVWEAGLGGGLGQLTDPTKVMHTASYDGGLTWSSPTDLAVQNNATPPEMTKNVSIGFDKNGLLVTVWTALPEDAIYYQISQDMGRSWSAPQPLRNLRSTWNTYVSRLDNSAMARDAAGNIHLILTGRLLPEEPSISVLHLIWDGTSWSPPNTVVKMQGDVPEWPRIAIANGNQLHAVWFVRDEENVWDSANGRYRIWYASASTDAPALAPIPWPTATPTTQLQPTATPAVTVIPTLAPVLATQPQEPASLAVIQTEVDDVWLILKSTAPTLLIVLVLAVGIWIRRR